MCSFPETSLEKNTYPSPKSQFGPKREVSVNVDLGQGYVGGQLPRNLNST